MSDEYMLGGYIDDPLYEMHLVFRRGDGLKLTYDEKSDTWVIVIPNSKKHNVTFRESSDKTGSWYSYE